MDSNYNMLDSNCPSRRVLDLIAQKWVILVIYALSKEKKRYSELQRMIGGVSQKMLTQTLRRMEGNCLITRTVYPVVPPLVEYELTELGVALLVPVNALKAYAEMYLDVTAHTPEPLEEAYAEAASD